MVVPVRRAHHQRRVIPIVIASSSWAWVVMGPREPDGRQAGLSHWSVAIWPGISSRSCSKDWRAFRGRGITQDHNNKGRPDCGGRFAARTTDLSDPGTWITYLELASKKAPKMRHLWWGLIPLSSPAVN